MNEVRCSYLRTFVFILFDDILIYGMSEEEHVKHLQAALQLLIDHKPFGNIKRCSFGQKKLEYLGRCFGPRSTLVQQLPFLCKA